MICRLSVPLVVLSLLSAAPALAEDLPDPDQLLKLAERNYDQMEYEAALRVLDVVRQHPKATATQKAYTYFYIGCCFTAIGQAENAVLAFMELLRIRRNYRPPAASTSPSIQAMFHEALRRMKLPVEPPPEAAQQSPGNPEGEGDYPVQVTAIPPRRATAGRPVDIQVQVKDPQRLVRRLLVRWRIEGGGVDFSTFQAPYQPGLSQLTVTIPGATITRGDRRLLFVIDAQDQDKAVIASAGSLDVPLAVRLDKPPWRMSKAGWWAVGITAGAVVAGGIVAAVLLTRGSPDTPKGYGDATITIK